MLVIPIALIAHILIIWLIIVAFCRSKAFRGLVVTLLCFAVWIALIVVMTNR
jgi:hypothetical protein